MRVDLDSNEVYCASFAVAVAATLMNVLVVTLLCCGIAKKVSVCASLNVCASTKDDVSGRCITVSTAVLLPA
jgi:hypothetical protein